MGYYDNPQIIQPDRSGELIGSAIANFGQSIGQGLTNRAERLRAQEKEDKLTIEKLQNRRNEIDLAYAKKKSEYSESEVDVNPEVNNKIRDIIKESSKNAADAQIKLISETDSKKRQEYLDMITKNDSLMENASKTLKVLGGTVSTYRLKAKAALIGKPGGYVVNGDSDADIENNTGFLDVLSGMASADKEKYKEQNLSVELDNSGTGFNITASGIYNDKPFNRPINTKAYVSADDDLDDALLSNVETMDTFYKEANLKVADKDNNILQGLLLQTYGTVDLPSTGTDKYQLVNARKLNVPMIQSKIKDEAEIKATGILAADNSSSLRTLIDYTLEKGVGAYKREFEVLKTNKEKQDYLTNLLAEKSFERLTAKIKRTPNKDGGFDYWNPDETSLKIKEKPKLTKVDGGNDNDNDNNEDSGNSGDYRSAYLDNLRKGVTRKRGENDYSYDLRSRKYYADNLNRLAGGVDKFTTSEDLYKRWLQGASGIKGSDKTLKEEYASGKLKGKDPIKDFFAEYGKAKMYYEQSDGLYKPITNYNLNKAASRAMLALDFTAGEGTKKKLQGKIGEAEQMDTLNEWTKNNPQKQGETIEQYTARYRKSLK